MKRLLSERQRVNCDPQSSGSKSKQLTTTLTKLVSGVILGVLAPVHLAQAAVAKSDPIDIGKEAYSLLSSAIAAYSARSGLINQDISRSKSSDQDNNVQELVFANQPIPSRFSKSLIAKALPAEQSYEDPATAKLEFEPVADLSNVSEVIKPVLLKREGTNQPVALNVLTTIKPLNLLAMEIKVFNDKNSNSDPNDQPSKISSQLLEKLDIGLEVIASTTGLAPELPSLIAKVYLPDTSDYGLSSNFVWPAQGLLSSGFGWRWGRLHQGIDIAAPVGTPIWAAASGIVDFAGWNNGGYGNLVDIRHANGAITRYAHLSAIYVKRGQSVNQSQVIAAMGSTGFSTGPHLHFEIRPNGRSAMNPMTFLARVISRG